MPRGDVRVGASADELDAIIPTDWGTRTRACLSCSLMKTVNQFLTMGCENCEFLKMAGDKERVMACTSSAVLG